MLPSLADLSLSLERTKVEDGGNENSRFSRRTNAATGARTPYFIFISAGSDYITDYKAFYSHTATQRPRNSSGRSLRVHNKLHMQLDPYVPAARTMRTNGHNLQLACS